MKSYEKKNSINKIWPVYIGEFHNPEHEEIKQGLINFFKDYMKKNPNSRSGGENYNLFESRYDLHKEKNETYKKLLKFIAQCVMATCSEANAGYATEIQKSNLEVTIKDSWFINYNEGGCVLPHQHPQCSWCCVYYVQVGKGASLTNGSTFFQKTLPYSHINDFGSTYNKRGMRMFTAEEGKLLVWPHFVMHGSLPYTGDKNRIIVSANTIVSSILNK